MLTSNQVSPDNDPRNINDGESLPDPEHHHHHHRHRHFDSDEDLDDDDDDLEEHLFRGPGGFFGQSTVFRAPDRQGPGNGPRAVPDNTDQIMRRFTELLGDIGGPTMVGRSGPETLFSSQPQRVTLQRFSGPGFSGGVSSFTITTGPGRTRTNSGPRVPGMDPDDPFRRYGNPIRLPYPRGTRNSTSNTIINANRQRRIFGNLMGDVGPPPGNQDGRDGGDGNPRPQADFSIALSQLIAIS